MRWYDPETGRWLSKDPIGLNGGLNLFVFCGCRPIDYLDPFGYAKIRTRPLDAGEKAYVKNAFTWTVSRINLPGDIDPRHREIFFEDGNDTDECPGSIGYGPFGVHKDTSQRSYNNTEWRVYEDKTMRVAVNNVRNRPEWAGDKYKVVAHNCQDFVSEVVKEYDRLNRGKLVKN